MTMKKFDLDKNMAKKLDRKLKAVIPPDRFAKQSQDPNGLTSKPNSLLAQLLKRNGS